MGSAPGVNGDQGMHAGRNEPVISLEAHLRALECVIDRPGRIRDAH